MSNPKIKLWANAFVWWSAFYFCSGWGDELGSLFLFWLGTSMHACMLLGDRLERRSDDVRIIELETEYGPLTKDGWKFARTLQGGPQGKPFVLRWLRWDDKEDLMTAIHINGQKTEVRLEGLIDREAQL